MGRGEISELSLAGRLGFLLAGALLGLAGCGVSGGSGGAAADRTTTTDGRTPTPNGGRQPWQGKWRVTTWEGDGTTMPAGGGTVELTFKGDMLVVRAGCRRLDIEVTIEDGVLHHGREFSRKAPCIGFESQSDSVLNILEDDPKLTVEDDTMVLTRGTDGTLTLARTS